MKHLFAYGTLMCDEIMREISGHTPESTNAVLRDYSRHAIKGEHYPGIQYSPDSSVQGILYRDISTYGWRRLDRFEGDMYARNNVQVELATGEILRAETYVIRNAFIHCLETSAWDFEEFLSQRKRHFQQQYKGYSEL
jgi:gamma-glutamylcyclotransferase (GGCT)/AIG2-like uncharacterized protein YtfP